MIYTLIPLCLIYFVRFKLAQHEIKRLRGILGLYNIKIDKLNKKNIRLNKIIARLR